MANPNFTVKQGVILETRLAEKASATVINPGDLVSVDSGGLIIQKVTSAAAGRTAFCLNGAAAGTTIAEVTQGNNFSLIGTASGNLAKANRGLAYDVTNSTGTQTINLSSTTYGDLRVSPFSDGGTVGATTGVEVSIVNPIFF